MDSYEGLELRKEIERHAEQANKDGDRPPQSIKNLLVAVIMGWFCHEAYSELGTVSSVMAMAFVVWSFNALFMLVMAVFKEVVGRILAED